MAKSDNPVGKRLRDQSLRIQELEDTVGNLEDMVIDQAQDLHNLQAQVDKLAKQNNLWPQRSF